MAAESSKVVARSPERRRGRIGRMAKRILSGGVFWNVRCGVAIEVVARSAFESINE